VNPKNVHAFSLIEVVISMGILSFCMVLLLGLLPVGIKTNELTSEETKALNLMTAIVSDLKYTPVGESQSSIFKLPAPPFAPDVTRAETNSVYFNEGWKPHIGTSPQPDSRFHVSWWYHRLPSPETGEPVEGIIRISWPARPNDKNSRWDASTEVFVSYIKPRSVP